MLTPHALTDARSGPLSPDGAPRDRAAPPAMPLGARRWRIAVIDDAQVNLDLLGHILRRLPGCEVETFLDPVAAIAVILEEDFDLVLTDYMMPGLDGIGVVDALRRSEAQHYVPVVMITTSGERDVRRAAIEAGATDFVHKPFDPVELRARLRNLLELSEARRILNERALGLSREVARATREIAEREREIVVRLMRATESRDTGTGDHIARVAGYVIAIAEGLSLPPEEVTDLALASTMHDVGKLAIPDAILSKPGPLTAEERAAMNDHTRHGFEILDGSRSRLIQLAAQIALSHHERWDGQGYPGGLVGSDIPLGGRIVAVADVFDALVSDRAYKPAWSAEAARQFIESEAGRQFDPDCVRAFCASWPEIKAYLAEVDLRGEPGAAAA